MEGVVFDRSAENHILETLFLRGVGDVHFGRNGECFAPFIFLLCCSYCFLSSMLLLCSFPLHLILRTACSAPVRLLLLPGMLKGCTGECFAPTPATRCGMGPISDPADDDHDADDDDDAAPDR